MWQKSIPKIGICGQICAGANFIAYFLSVEGLRKNFWETQIPSCLQCVFRDYANVKYKFSRYLSGADVPPVSSAFVAILTMDLFLVLFLSKYY